MTRSFTLRRGSRTVHLDVCPHSPRAVTQEVICTGPSMASMMSNAVISDAGFASVYPPRVPCWELKIPFLASRCKIFAING